MTTSMERAIEEMRRVGEAQTKEQEAEEQKAKLAEALLNRRVVGIQHIAGDAWALLLENGMMIEFKHSTVAESEWRMRGM